MKNPPKLMMIWSKLKTIGNDRSSHSNLPPPLRPSRCPPCDERPLASPLPSCGAAKEKRLSRVNVDPENVTVTSMRPASLAIAGVVSTNKAGDNPNRASRLRSRTTLEYFLDNERPLSCISDQMFVATITDSN
eukprot:3206080-Rhodomonas_salina.1